MGSLDTQAEDSLKERVIQIGHPSQGRISNGDPELNDEIEVLRSRLANYRDDYKTVRDALSAFRKIDFNRLLATESNHLFNKLLLVCTDLRDFPSRYSAETPYGLEIRYTLYKLLPLWGKLLRHEMRIAPEMRHAGLFTTAYRQFSDFIEYQQRKSSIEEYIGEDFEISDLEPEVLETEI